MARQKGIIKVEGTLDALTFYKSQDGYLVKTKSGVTAERMATDPAFIRTRENAAEFANAAKSGKLTRNALQAIISKAVDGRMVSRFTQVMTKINKLDTINARGQRNIGTAIASADAKALLKGFEFNANALLGSILTKPYVVDATTGVITIKGLVIANDIAFPAGTTHVSITGCYANINYVTKVTDVQLTGVSNLAINAPATDVTLRPTALPIGTGTKLFLLKIEFFQEVNGLQYALQSGAFNALRIIDIE